MHILIAPFHFILFRSISVSILGFITSHLCQLSGPHRMEIVYLSFAFPTFALQLLSNCCTPKSITNMIATYTRAEMCIFIGIHSTKHIIIAFQGSKHLRDNIYSRIYSSVNIILALPLNHEKLCCFINEQSFVAMVTIGYCNIFKL